MNKKLLRSVREYKKQSILAPLLVILEVLMEVLIPLEMAKIIDVGIAQGNLSYILQRGIILVVMAMLSLFFGVQAGNMAAYAAAGYAKNLRHDIFYKVQDFSFKNIDHFSTSGLVTRMTTDITNVQQAYMMSIRLLARAPFMIILSWIMTLTISKPASILFLVAIPFLGGTLIFIAKAAHPHFIRVFDEYDVLNNSVQENVNASRVVKAFVREDYEIEKFIGPGEIVRLRADGMEQMRKPNEGMQICSFLWVYYGFPVSCYEGKNVEDVRFMSGYKMGQKDDSEVDCACGIPDSGVGMALGYAEGKGVPYHRAIAKYTPTWPRSFTPANQEMRSLVCAQCHVEYYFKGDGKYLTFPWDKGSTVEDMEAYYDEAGFADYTHKLSRAPILKAQHPDYEISQMGIHAQRGVSCADCHMPYKSEGGVKYSDHHIQSPLAMIDRTCQVCHRESEETLRNNVYERQNKANEMRNRLETELAKAHVEAKFAWDKGATEDQMKDVLKLIRQAQWRWDFGVASHGGAFHAPQEIQRILGNGLDKAMQARLATAKVLAKLGYTDDVPMPDFSTKEKAQQYIGLDMAAERTAKEKFLNTIVPQWVKEAQENNRLAKNI